MRSRVIEREAERLQQRHPDASLTECLLLVADEADVYERDEQEQP